jgi:hypothetical protein
MRGQPGMRRTYLRSVPLPDRASSGHMTLSLPVKRPHKGRYGTTSGCACAEHTYGHGIFRSHDFVTPVKKAPLCRICRNFRLHIRRTYFRTGHVTDITSDQVADVTSGHVTSGSSTASLHRKGDLSCAHIYNLRSKKVPSYVVTTTFW